MIHQLIYVSTALRIFSNVEVGEILSSARSHNSQAGITGMLLFHDGNFFQVLEGEEQAVSACYARIEKDHRHKSPIVLMRQQKQQRSFANWSMGHAKPSDMSDEHQDIIISLSHLVSHLDAMDERDAPEFNMLAKNFVNSFRKFDPL